MPRPTAVQKPSGHRQSDSGGPWLFGTAEPAGRVLESARAVSGALAQSYPPDAAWVFTDRGHVYAAGGEPAKGEAVVLWAKEDGKQGKWHRLGEMEVAN